MKTLGERLNAAKLKFEVYGEAGIGVDYTELAAFIESERQLALKGARENALREIVEYIEFKQSKAPEIPLIAPHFLKELKLHFNL